MPGHTAYGQCPGCGRVVRLLVVDGRTDKATVEEFCRLNRRSGYVTRTTTEDVRLMDWGRCICAELAMLPGTGDEP